MTRPWAPGTEKVRLTRGEPSRVASLPTLSPRRQCRYRQIAVTTNGYRSARDVAGWRDAGLTADPRQRRQSGRASVSCHTGQDKFRKVMDGIDAAFNAGFER
ncbi:hypothetical protein ACNKHQ_04325 [Shigella flexneri]